MVKMCKNVRERERRHKNARKENSAKEPKRARETIINVLQEKRQNSLLNK